MSLCCCWCWIVTAWGGGKGRKEKENVTLEPNGLADAAIITVVWHNFYWRVFQFNGRQMYLRTRTFPHLERSLAAKCRKTCQCGNKEKNIQDVFFFHLFLHLFIFLPSFECSLHKNGTLWPFDHLQYCRVTDMSAKKLHLFVCVSAFTCLELKPC